MIPTHRFVFSALAVVSLGLAACSVEGNPDPPDPPQGTAQGCLVPAVDGGAGAGVDGDAGCPPQVPPAPPPPPVDP
jgi:hypothetical protein